MTTEVTGSASTTWAKLAARLRPFIRTRVQSDADADDVLQDVLLRIHRGEASVENRERFTSWMFRVARNAIVDHGRVRQRHPVAKAKDEVDASGSFDESDDDTRSKMTGCVSMFVAALPSPYREAITLVELEGLTHREAAAMTRISVSGMKSRVQRGRQQLRTMFEDCCAIALDARNAPLECEARPDGTRPC